MAQFRFKALKEVLNREPIDIVQGRESGFRLFRNVGFRPDKNEKIPFA